MRFSLLRVVPLVLLAHAAASCSKTECTPGEIKPDSTCYTGQDGTAGKGICKVGHFTCGSDSTWGSTCDGEVLPAEETCNGLDDNCDGVVDEGLTNLCGGCGKLMNGNQAASPGDACGDCRVLACDGTEALRCLSAGETSGAACKNEDGCDGTYSCPDGQHVSCEGPAKNACGRCGGSVITDLGDPCQVGSCPGGKKVCNATNDGTVCVGPKENNCGVCGAPDDPNVGKACTSSNGCQGTIQCGGACVTTMKKNECGACIDATASGIPSNQLPGATCTSPGTAATGGGCAGTYVCDPSGLRTVCSAPPRNNCGACGMPNVDGVSPATSCVGDDGCTGVWKCDPAGSGTRVCLNSLNIRPKKNECGVCNAAPIAQAQLPGTLATYSYSSGANNLTCPSIYLCNGGSTAIMPLKQNACGLCPAVPAATTPYSTTGITAPLTGLAPGATCTYSNPTDPNDPKIGCSGSAICLANQTGTVCSTTVTKNECGVCGAPTVPTAQLAGTAANYTDPNDATKICASKYLCKADGSTAVQPVAQNACGMCPTAAQLASATTYSATPVVGTLTGSAPGTNCTYTNPSDPTDPKNSCGGTFTCKADQTGTVCTTTTTKNNCGTCGQPNVDLTGTCTGTNNCTGTKACSADGKSFVCNTPYKNNCGVCGDPYGDVQGIGQACWDAANGCSSVQECVNDPLRPNFKTAACKPNPKNACGKCGGTAIASAQAPGQACTNAAGCTGTYYCDTTGDATATPPIAANDRTLCNAPAKNNCGACGLPNVNYGGTCTDDNGCTSHTFCNDTGDGTVCLPVYVNSCGKCQGATLPGYPGVTYTDTRSGCSGTWRCLAGNNGMVLDGACVATHLVISELSLAGTAGGSDSFVELYNPGTTAASLSGMTLWYFDGTAYTQLVAFGASASVAPGGFFLVAHAPFTTPAADATYSAVLSAAGGAVLLVNGTTEPTGAAGAVDALGWGTSSVFEGAVATAPAAGSSLERKADMSSNNTLMTTGAHATIGNGFDSNSNSYDFVTRTARQPQNTASAVETR